MFNKGRDTMEKAYKYFCVFMSAIILFSSVCMVFSSSSENNVKADFLNCNEIVNNIKNYELNMTSIVYAKNSKGEWEEYQRIHGTENRIWVEIEKIPQQLIDAFISIEDQRFYKHAGIDWKRTTAAFVNYLPFVNLYSTNQGGSTITQQLIKNITGDNEQGALRKIREIPRAFLIEKMLDKTTILEAYLNTISLGNGICGVEVAANYYFNKNVNDLTLAECASLAAITKNPSAYNPLTKPDDNKERRNDVLYKMYDLKKITKEQYNNALKEKVVVDKTQQMDYEIPINNYFIDALIDDVVKDLSIKYNCSTTMASTMLYNGGYKIYATVDSNVQEAMESVYTDQNTYFPQKYSKDKSIHVQSAMTIMDYSGNIKGIVGGAGEKTVNRGLNRATDSPRQPGSTMKPLGVYVQAIENGYAHFSSDYEDKPMKNYQDGKPGPKEWYGEYEGVMTVAEALERSANTIPCWILRDQIGIENSFDFLTKKLKFQHLSDEDKNLSSLALGGCSYGITTTESAAAYAIFGNGGVYYEPTTYTQVLDMYDQKILESNTGTQVIKSSTATIMNRLLQNVVYGPQGTGGGIAWYSNMRAYAKTGTSSESKDLWMVAGTPYYVGSVWYGFDQPENIYNQGAAARVWRDVMKKVHSELEHKDFEYYDDITTAKYCIHTGNIALKTCESRLGYYLPGEKPAKCTGKHPENDKDKDKDDIKEEADKDKDKDKDDKTEKPTSSLESSNNSSKNESEGNETKPSEDSSSEVSSSENTTSDEADESESIIVDSVESDEEAENSDSSEESDNESSAVESTDSDEPTTDSSESESDNTDTEESDATDLLPETEPVINDQNLIFLSL